MPDLPSHQDLYDEAKAEVLGSNRTKLNDFQSGSMLDAIVGVVATLARGVMRWIARQMRRTFISTAADGDLEFVAVDMFGEDVVRKQGESFEDYKDRVERYRDNALARGTPGALRWYASDIDGVTAVTVDEEWRTGITTVEAIFDPDETDAQTVTDAFYDGLDAWRTAGGPVNLEATEKGTDQTTTTTVYHGP